MATYREQVRALEADLENKQAILERQRGAYEQAKAQGSVQDVMIPKERVNTLERDISKLKSELEQVRLLAEQEPEPKPVNTSKQDKQALELIKALYVLWVKSYELAKQVESKSAPSGMLILVIAKELRHLLVRLSLAPAFLEQGKQAGIDWNEVR